MINDQVVFDFSKLMHGNTCVKQCVTGNLYKRCYCIYVEII